MKIWMLTTEYPPFYGGGIATYAAHTAEMLMQRGHDITVFTPDGSIDQDLQTDLQHGWRVVRFKSGKDPIYASLGYTAALSYDFCQHIRRFMQQEGRPHLLEAQDYMAIAYFLIHKKMELEPDLLDLPIFINLHTPKFITDELNQLPTFHFPGYWVGEMERYCLQAADGIISPSHFLLQQLRQRGLELDPQRVHVLPNPFPDHKKTHPKAYTPYSQRKRLLFLGRVQYLKGLENLLRFLSKQWDRGLDLPLDIIGGDSIFVPKDCSYQELLSKKFAVYLKKGLLRFCGLLPQEEIVAYLKTAKLVFVPSLFESFSYVAAEAMAAGKIVLASVQGGQGEFILDGESGFLFHPEESASFEQAFNKALSLSDEAALAMENKALNTIRQHCNFQKISEQKTKIWQEAIDKGLQLPKERRTAKEYPFIRQLPKIEGDPSYQPREAGLLSIIVPYYNMGAWVEETIRSLMAVTYEKKEILILNDGSTDEKSLQKLQELSAKYPLQVVHQENGGLSSARNTGARHAKGEFLAFLDADDCIRPDFYSRGIALLQHYTNVSFVGCWIEYFEGATGKWVTWDPEPPYLLVHNTVNSSGLVYKTEDFFRCGWNDPRMLYGMEDYESVVSMVAHGLRGVVLTDVFFDYRVRKDSMSRQFNPNNQLYLYGVLSAKHRKFYDGYAYEIFNLLNSNGPSYHYENPTIEIGKGDLQYKESIFHSAEIPWELKEILKKFWKNQAFRKFAKLFFKLRLHKLF